MNTLKTNYHENLRIYFCIIRMFNYYFDICLLLNKKRKMNLILMIIGYFFGVNTKKKHNFSHVDKPTIYKDTRYWVHDQQTEYKIYLEYHKKN